MKLENKRTKFVSTPVADIEDLVVMKKANPRRMDKNLVYDSPDLIYRAKCANDIYMIWVFLNCMTAEEKIFPNFAGWRLSVRKNKNVSAKKTVNLPPTYQCIRNFFFHDLPISILHAETMC